MQASCLDYQDTPNRKEGGGRGEREKEGFLIIFVFPANGNEEEVEGKKESW